MKDVRYSGLLQEHNSAILEFGSPYGVCWHIAALEMKRRGLDSAHVLEFGCGEGHASRALLSQTAITMDLLDINPAMIGAAEARLSGFSHAVNYIESGVHEYLHSAAFRPSYEVIFSSFVMHNFPREERQKLLVECHAAMKPGGTFILNDCIPPPIGDTMLLARQLHRYRYLPDDVREQLIAHVKQDATIPFYMPESQIVRDLTDAGFSNVEVVDRVEREALIFANS